MHTYETVRCSIGIGLLAVSLCLVCTALLGEEQVQPYDGRCEGPCPPEAIASLLDPLTENGSGKVALTLVRHLNPSMQPPGRRAIWVCMLDGKPQWVIATAPGIAEAKGSGITARALKRAREFLAKHEELKGKEAPLARKPDGKTLIPANQRKNYGLQITEIKLIDRKTESWEVTAKPIEDCLGGEIWMRFDKEHEVSAEYGK